jgi:hypothetical protein
MIFTYSKIEQRWTLPGIKLEQGFQVYSENSAGFVYLASLLFPRDTNPIPGLFQ